MSDTNQLPPHTITINDHPEPHIMQWSDLELAAIKKYAESYALQAIAQATQAEVTDELLRPGDFNVEVVMKQTGGFDPVRTHGVRVTHKPTGISVTCDAARSQHTNRHHAFEQLRAILALRPSTAPDLSCKSVQARLAAQWGYVRPIALPMTDAQRNDMICTVTTLCAKLSRQAIAGMAIDWTEAHHGITAQAKKETP